MVQAKKISNRNGVKRLYSRKERLSALVYFEQGDSMNSFSAATVRGYPPIIYGLIAVTYYFTLQHNWALSADGWAEVISNYFQVAHSNISLLEQLFAKDYGYVAPLLRIIPMLCAQLSINQGAELITYNLAAIALTAVLPMIILSDRYATLIPRRELRLLIAVFAFASLNFETRTYINFSIIFFLPCAVILLNVIKTKSMLVVEAVTLLLLIIGKPTALALVVPLVYGLVVVPRYRFIFLSALFLCVLQVLFMTGTTGVPNNLMTSSGLLNLLVLTAYNFTKLFSLGIGPIALKLLPEYFYQILWAIIIFGGFFCAWFFSKNGSDRFSYQVLAIQVAVNIVWSALLLSGTQVFSYENQHSSIDFNRYDAITIFNVLCIVIVLRFNFFGINHYKKCVIALTIATLAYSIAPVYYFEKVIKSNLYYLGTSTWAQLSEDPLFKCKLLSPLGWGDTCIILTNVKDRTSSPTVKLENRELSFSIRDLYEDGVVVFFAEGPASAPPLLSTHHGQQNVKPITVTLFNRRIAYIFTSFCSRSEAECIFTVQFNGQKLFYTDPKARLPLHAWYENRRVW